MATARRVGLLVRHNVTATNFGRRYWLFLAAGLVEPLFYLFTFGVGIDQMTDRDVLYRGTVHSYAAFVAPGMLAVSAMSGVLAIAVFGFFAKLNHSRVFEIIFATPVRAFEIAIGELAWALSRVGMFSALFLVVMVALRCTTAGWALVALPGAILVAAAFGSVGMAVTTLLRGWQDFDTVIMVQTALLLFSGTLFPIDVYPGVLRIIVSATPLYQGIELLRGLSLGAPHVGLFGNAAYLIVLTVVGVYFTRRRVERHLRR